MNKLFALTLGIISSIGGFFDMGEIVMTGVVGARFGFGLIWVVILGTVGIIMFGEMSGRIATLTERPVFDIVRERLGAKVALVNLSASLVINLVTLVAEVAGISIAFQLLTGISYFLWVPLAMILVFIIVWKVSFEAFERTTGIVGLAMIVFAVALWRLHPDWGHILVRTFNPDVPKSETVANYWYFAVAIFGSAMTPYEVFFYSSGAVEEKWGRSDLSVNKMTAYVGFFVGGFLAASAIALAALVFKPEGITVNNLSTVPLGPAHELGTIGIVAFIVGLFASTIGAAVEVTMSNGYALSQYFGWTWGKRVEPRRAARFHLTMIVSLILAAVVVLSSVDPVKVTEISVVLSAFALPLTYFPVLIVANDTEYMGEYVNGRTLNYIGSAFLVVIVTASVAALPLMIWTRMGS